MYYGLQLSASGMLTSLYRTDVLGNNLANVNTTGFKPDFPVTRQRDVVTDEDGVGYLPSNELLEKLGAGAHMAPNEVNFAPAALKETHNPLDLAIEGSGFFVLRDSANEGATGLLFTRDGRFTRNSDGELVQAASGLPVLSERGGLIRIPGDGPISIDELGRIQQDGEVVAQLRVADVMNKEELNKAGENSFRPTRAALQASIDPTGLVRQGFLEDSGVNEIQAMLMIQGATKAVGINTTMIRHQDRMMERAINTFGRSA